MYSYNKQQVNRFIPLNPKYYDDVQDSNFFKTWNYFHCILDVFKKNAQNVKFYMSNFV